MYCTRLATLRACTSVMSAWRMWTFGRALRSSWSLGEFCGLRASAKTTFFSSFVYAPGITVVSVGV